MPVLSEKAFLRKDVLRNLVLAVLILAGVFVRFFDLGTHFTNVDDIGVAKTILNVKAPYAVVTPQQEPILPPLSLDLSQQTIPFWEKLRDSLTQWGEAGESFKSPLLPFVKLFLQFTAVPRAWTYAPLQFLVTHFLLEPEQTYRQKIFWGRFPSFLFGVGALLLIPVFYRRYDRFQTPVVFVALSVLVFSWENIIYAKQMESYAIGVFSAVALLIFLVRHFEEKRLTRSRILADACMLALLSHAQYQILFMMPAYMATLFAYYWDQKDSKKNILATLTLGCVVYGLLITPMFFLFLIHHVDAGITGSNAGPLGQFKFSLPEGSGFWQGVAYTVAFFVRNFFIVFSAHTAFVPENSPFFYPASVFLFGLFLLGVFEFCRSRDVKKKMMLTFFLILATTWFLLILFQKLTLGPTRHTLILLPFIAITLGEGWNFFLRKTGLLGKRPGGVPYATQALVATVALLFFAYFRPMTQARQDPFDADQIRSWLKQYGVETILAADHTWNLDLMKGIIGNYNYFAEATGGTPYPLRFGGRDYYETLAYVSQRRPLTRESFERMKRFVNFLMYIRQGIPLTYDFDDYEIVFSKEITSDVEIEFSNRTKNGSNNLFFYVLEKK